jgi:hypothetical protein
MEKKPRVAPVIAYVRQLGPGHFTYEEAAAALGLTGLQLRRWAGRNWELYGPRHEVIYGKQRMAIWTTEDIHRVKKNMQKQKNDSIGRSPGSRGAPRLFTKKEARDRQRLRSRETYHHQAAARARGMDDEEEATRQEALRDAVRAKLDTQRAERLVELSSRVS